jgi:uncharacterized NAD(P)/FAD-binding protein YdhS
MKRITIIGGGASGTLLAVNLIKNNNGNPLEINLVERQRSIGHGVAYSTTHEAHLLNVPAAKMGAFPDDVEHFYKWLREGGFEFLPGDFVPRSRYGEYLREVLADAVANRGDEVSVNILGDEAIDILTSETSAMVLLNSGEVLPSHKVILAFGNFLPPNICSEPTAGKYFRNAWSAEHLDKIDIDDHILVVGTGLTAVDNILSLYGSGHKGKITGISTHGWLPMVHQAIQPYGSIASELENQNRIVSIFRTIRRHCKKAENWRAVIDALRPETQKTWLRLPLAEKRRFMRHLRRVWDISRHRMAPECMAILNKMQESGQLTIRRGKIADIRTVNNRFKVRLRKRGRSSVETVDAIINCIGSESNFGKIDLPLVQSLIERGEIEPDELGLGLNATPDGKIINRQKEISNVISTLGTSLKGILWESTAMPEIRVQARNLALNLLAE